MRRTLLALAIFTLIASVQVQARDDSGKDISKINGGITAEAGQSYGDLDTVNGGISVREGASADGVETVNGGISLDDDAQVESVSAVNGGIKAGERVKVRNDVSTVNGGIRFGFNSTVGGNVETVNGTINIKQTTVGGDVKTVKGDVTIGAKSVVHGGIVIEKPTGFSMHWGKKRIPLIIIGPDAVVEGSLRFEQEVRLYVHTSAKIGSVIGATAKPYTDSIPAD
jgi:DUF4097 and DUF4098 domain-containing protein YvlB